MTCFYSQAEVMIIGVTEEGPYGICTQPLLGSLLRLLGVQELIMRKQTTFYDLDLVTFVSLNVMTHRSLWFCGSGERLWTVL